MILTNSEATTAELTRAFPGSTNRIRTTPFGTPTWVLDRQVAGPPPPVGAPFLFIGALEPRKNLLNILKAVEEVHRQSTRAEARPPGPCLHVVGAPGWRNEVIMKKLRRMEQEGTVVFEGHQNRDVLWQRLTAARALLLPSLHEGFGFPILEAMAAGTPVITSDRGAMREVAGDAALLVNPEDSGAIARAMLRLEAEPMLAAGLSERGQVRAQQFRWSRTAAQTLDIYRMILDHQASGITAGKTLSV